MSTDGLKPPHCPNCGGVISLQAPACVHCGHPIGQAQPSPSGSRDNVVVAVRTPTSPAAAWSFGLGVGVAALWLLALLAGSIPRNAFAGFMTVVLLGLIGVAAVLAIALGWAALRQLQRDQRLHGKTLAILGIVIGAVALPPALLLLFAGMGMVIGLGGALVGILVGSAALAFMGYRTFLWQVAREPLRPERPHTPLKKPSMMVVGSVVGAAVGLILIFAFYQAAKGPASGAAQRAIEEGRRDRVQAAQNLIVNYGSCLADLGYNVDLDELVYRTGGYDDDTGTIDISVLHEDRSYLLVEIMAVGRVAVWRKGSNYDNAKDALNSEPIAPPC